MGVRDFLYISSSSPSSSLSFSSLRYRDELYTYSTPSPPEACDNSNEQPTILLPSRRRKRIQRKSTPPHPSFTSLPLLHFPSILFSSLLVSSCPLLSCVVRVRIQRGHKRREGEQGRSKRMKRKEKRREENGREGKGREGKGREHTMRWDGRSDFSEWLCTPVGRMSLPEKVWSPKIK